MKVPFNKPPDIANNLAWILATDPDPTLRDPQEAVRLAEDAARGPHANDPGLLDTLAVSYKAAGRNDDALRTARRAAALAREAGREALAREIEANVADLEPAP